MGANEPIRTGEDKALPDKDARMRELLFKRFPDLGRLYKASVKSPENLAVGGFAAKIDSIVAGISRLGYLSEADLQNIEAGKYSLDTAIGGKIPETFAMFQDILEANTEPLLALKDLFAEPGTES
jgi:hypothetical protein